MVPASRRTALAALLTFACCCFALTGSALAANDNNPNAQGHGANASGPFDGDADGSPSGNGNGGGNATGKPCAGCVGKADDKNPPGQSVNDNNNGYECDNNHGIGKTNPAHTRTCTTTVTTCPPGTTLTDGQCVTPPTGGGECPAGTTLVNGVCTGPPAGETCPTGTTLVNGVCTGPPSEPTCPAGTTLINGVCVAPPVISVIEIPLPPAETPTAPAGEAAPPTATAGASANPDTLAAQTAPGSALPFTGLGTWILTFLGMTAMGSGAMLKYTARRRTARNKA
jgi:hypothetical protein